MSTASGDDYLVADPATLLTAADTSAPLAGEAKAPTAQWPFLIVAAVAVFGIGLITTGSLQQGLAGLVAAMALAALLRLVLPTATAGWLGSRSRGADVAGFSVLAVALGTVTLLLG